MDLISKISSALKYGKFRRSAKKLTSKINSLESNYQKTLSDDQVPEKFSELKRRACEGESLDSLLPETYALVKNAARRLLGKKFEVLGIPETWNMVHYDVQIEGGIALHRGMVAELATGEGKTLVATLPACLNALSGKGVHIATVNEYLAERDSQWMGFLYSFLGLSSSCALARQSQEEKKNAYKCDIVYGTASEFGFDYLRDNSMTRIPEERVQRGFNYCIVDEADSVLIDEARTPLIISGPEEFEKDGALNNLIKKVEPLVAKQHKLCNSLAIEAEEMLKRNSSDEEAFKKLWLVKKGMPKNKRLKELAKRGEMGSKFSDLEKFMDSDFNKVVSYSLKEQLYFTVDEKSERSDLTEKGRKFLSGDGKYAFEMPDIELEISRIESDNSIDDSEKSRLKAQARGEFAKISENIHSINQLLRAYSLYEKDEDYIVRGGKIEIIDRNTGRVMEGRRWSDGLHQAVEAKERVKIERENRTYATIGIQNYFRKYLKLAGMTGTASSSSSEFFEVYGMNVVEIRPNKPCQRKDLPDLIFASRREKFNAVRDILAREHAKGRPVLVGTSSVEESEVLSRLLKISKIPHEILNAKNDAAEARIVARAGQRGAITISTNMAGRGTDIKLGDGIEELGGLLVIGTEHHESERVDRQLMGRCARQGDKGETVFACSLEDSLFRLHANVSFLSKAIKKRHREGVPMSHPIFARIVSRAQKHAEGENFSARKWLIKFDEAADKQREIIYSLRDSVVCSENPAETLLEMAGEECDSIAERAFSEEKSESVEKIRSRIGEHFSEVFPRNPPKEILSEENIEKIKKILRREAGEIIRETLNSAPKNEGDGIAKFSMLRAVDSAWRDHLTRLEDLRESVYLRGYAQRDPVQEFNKEAFKAFEETMERTRKDSCAAFFKIFASRQAAAKLMEEALRAAERRSAKRRA